MSSSVPSDPGQLALAGQRRKWVFAAVGVTVAVLACVVFVLGRREPVYLGVKISHIIESRGSEESALAALELGPDQVVPYLIEALHGQNSSFKRARMALWKRLPQWYVNKHRSQMPIPAESIRIKAFWALALIGPEASAAIPDVARFALDDSANVLQHYGVSTLGHIGTDSPQALEVLLKLVNGTNSALSAGAAVALARFGALAKPALPRLIHEFDRDIPKAPESTPPMPTRRMTFAAVSVLSALGADAAEAVPLLVEALDDENLAPHAVSVLRRIGPAAAEAVPGLARYIDARKPQYFLAVEALMNIGPAARPTLPLLRQVAEGTNALPRVMAAVAIARLENNPAAAVPVLIREVQAAGRASSRDSWTPPFWDPSKSTISLDPPTTAAWFLGEIGSRARDAIPALAARLTNRLDWTCLVAAQAIWKINQETNLALPPLLESLQNTNRGDLGFVLGATLLGQLGSAALPAVPDLIQHRKRNWTTWRSANDALKQIQPPGADRPR